MLFKALHHFSFQITFSKTNTSLTVNDDCVKGALKVNFRFFVKVDHCVFTTMSYNCSTTVVPFITCLLDFLNLVLFSIFPLF